MNNKKIPTGVGTVILVIIAITIGVFVLKYEEKINKTQTQNLSVFQNKTSKNQDQTNQQLSLEKSQTINIDQTTWKKYSDARISFSYPKDCLLNASSDSPNEKNPNTYSFNKCFDEKFKWQFFIYNSLDPKYIEDKINLPNTTKVDDSQTPSGKEILVLQIQDDITKSKRFLSFISKKNSNISLEIYGPSISASPEEISSYNLFVKGITINNTEDVSFCGKTYQISIIDIKGVDVVRRIAQILSANKYENVCNNYKTNTKNGDFLDVNLQPNQAGSTYFDIFVYKYKIDSYDNIYILNGFDGNPELIGKLK